jgi:hypothetical protein
VSRCPQKRVTCESVSSYPPAPYATEWHADVYLSVEEQDHCDYEGRELQPPMSALEYRSGDLHKNPVSMRIHSSMDLCRGYYSQT